MVLVKGESRDSAFESAKGKARAPVPASAEAEA